MFLLDVPASFKSVIFCVNIAFQKFLTLLGAVTLRCSLKNGMTMIKNLIDLINLIIAILDHQKPKARRLFRQFYKNNVFFDRYDKKCFRSVNCYGYATRYIYVKSSQPDKLLYQINR